MLQLIELFNEKKWGKYEYLLNKYIEMLEKLNEIVYISRPFNVLVCVKFICYERKFYKY